jgi:hypothetical protein
MRGVGLPGHFMITPDFADLDLLVDAFNGVPQLYIYTHTRAEQVRARVQEGDERVRVLPGHSSITL